MSAKEKIRVTVDIPVQMYKKIVSLVSKDDVSVSQVIRKAIKEFFKPRKEK